MWSSQLETGSNALIVRKNICRFASHHGDAGITKNFVWNSVSLLHTVKFAIQAVINTNIYKELR